MNVAATTSKISNVRYSGWRQYNPVSSPERPITTLFKKNFSYPAVFIHLHWTIQDHIKERMYTSATNCKEYWCTEGQIRAWQSKKQWLRMSPVFSIEIEDLWPKLLASLPSRQKLRNKAQKLSGGSSVRSWKPNQNRLDQFTRRTNTNERKLHKRVSYNNDTQTHKIFSFQFFCCALPEYLSCSQFKNNSNHKKKNTLFRGRLNSNQSSMSTKVMDEWRAIVLQPIQQIPNTKGTGVTLQIVVFYFV